ncbi:D-alanyl-D-alanine carboxypeptidase, partial [Francisellaceae bacterium]|nr:D-alanyl-D-alanine carboxypeptidase [Francisellaceae bacterium]
MKNLIKASLIFSTLGIATFATTATVEKAPLNKYGAVNVDAQVPVNIQVPTAPKNFKAPAVHSAVSLWSNLVPAQPKLDIKSYLLMDAKTGHVIASDHANKRIAPASLTKLMLLYIVEQQLKNGTLTLNQKLTVPTVAWATGGSRMFLKPKTEVSVKELIKGVIVASGNDAAVTLAVNIAGTQSAFVGMMNIEAKKLGMTNTHFSDVMGLPAPNLYSSARDLAMLARHVVLDYPEYYHFFKVKYITYNGIKQPNFNKLLFIDQYADGLKTGSTKAAGYSLIGSEKRPNERRL